MKVSFIIQDLFGQGAEYATALMVRGFIAKGYAVDLLVSKIHADYLSVGRIPFDVPKETNWIHLKGRHARENILALRQYLKTTDSTAVVSMIESYDKALVVAGLGLRNKPKIYTVQHGISFALDESLNYKPANNRWFVRLKHKIYYSFFAGVLGVSQRVSDEMSRIYHIPKSKVHTVFNPVYDDEYLQKMRNPPSHPWLQHKTLPTFVAAGSFTKDKDHLTVLQAVKLLVSRCPVRLIIYGQGHLRRQYEKFIDDNGLQNYISLPGFCTTLPAEISHASGYISSSEVESFGIAIAEGLVCGVPVISTNAPCGPREVLMDGEYGQLVEPHNPESLAQAIMLVAKWLISKARPESYERFEVSKIVELYEEAIGLKKE